MPEPAYFAALVERLGSILGRAVAGVYAGGSYALGDYERARSDLDVAAVSERPLTDDEKQRIVAVLCHNALPCPARGLELVVYTAEAAGAATTKAAFELNLNTGHEMEFRADFEPVPRELHWFAIDRSVLHQHGIALAGPPAAEVFADPGRDALLPVLADALRWCLRDGPGSEAVLTACRAVRYADEGVWSSKPAAARWAAGRVEDDDLAAEALRARTSGESLDPARAASFLEAALVRLDAAEPPRTA